MKTILKQIIQLGIPYLIEAIKTGKIKKLPKKWQTWATIGSIGAVFGGGWYATGSPTWAIDQFKKNNITLEKTLTPDGSELLGPNGESIKFEVTE